MCRSKKRFNRNSLWLASSTLNCPQFQNQSTISFFQEIFYYTADGNVLKSENSTTESATVTGTEKGNKELIESLTGDGGPLASGALPEAEAANEAGQKSLLEAVHGATATAKGGKSLKTKERAEKADPKTALEYGAQNWFRHICFFTCYYPMS